MRLFNASCCCCVRSYSCAEPSSTAPLPQWTVRADCHFSIWGSDLSCATHRNSHSAPLCIVQLQKFSRVCNEVLRRIAAQQSDTESLKLSAALLEQNPECYTVWNYRRKSLQSTLQVCIYVCVRACVRVCVCLAPEAFA